MPRHRPAWLFWPDVPPARRGADDGRSGAGEEEAAEGAGKWEEEEAGAGRGLEEGRYEGRGRELGLAAPP